LISESDRLEARCSELEIVATAYHDLRVDHAALKEKNKKSTLTEILVTLAIGTGSIGLALGQRLLSVDGAHETGYAMMIGAALLIVAALVNKAWK
jgi:hypothetical protein